MKKILAIATLVLLGLSNARATRGPVLGGPGLVHVQSAKIGQGLGYRTLLMLASYSGENYYGLNGKQNSLIDLWNYHSVNYAPAPSFSLMATGVAHNEEWTVTNAAGFTSLDNSMGCPGDIVLSGKYHAALADERIDLAVEPMLSIPMDRTKFNDPASQSGKLDFGAKALLDYNMQQTTLYANLGYLTRGGERSILPLGVGAEYGFSQQFSAFVEASGELRPGADKLTYPDSAAMPWLPNDQSEFRFSPGVHWVPFATMIVGFSLSADIGLTKASAPWQIVFGLDFPAAAGRVISGPILGTIAGMIKDRDSQVPMKGMITFPGSDVPGVVSDEMGVYTTKLQPGDYKIHIYANGYRWLERKLVIKPGKGDKWDLTLKRKLGTVNGAVVDGTTGLPVAATISIEGSNLSNIANDSTTGEFTATLPPGKYKIVARAAGYDDNSKDILVKDKSQLTPVLTMDPAGTSPVATFAEAANPVPQAAAATLPAAEAQSRIVMPEPPSAPRTAPAAKPAAAKLAAARPAEPKPAAPVPAAAAPAKLSPDQVAALYKTGVQQFMNEEYDKAQATFKSVLKADPANAKAKEYLNKTKERIKKLKG